MSEAAAAISVFAPAKINLTLHITGRRADGYHEMESLVAFADIGDGVEVAPAAEFSFRADGPFAAGLPPAEDNLMVRAARLLAAHFGRPLDFSLRLTKNLPLASGLGGGSADVTATARGLCRLWEVDFAAALPLLTSLGSDMLACAAGTPHWMTGTGDRLAPAPLLPPVWLVLVNPLILSPTPAVYAALRGRFSVPPARPAAFADFAALIDFLRHGDNDLAAPAQEIVPEIGAVLGSLAGTEGCALARLSGSGATRFGLFATSEAAAQAAQQMSAAQPGWWVRATALRPPIAV